MSPVRTAGQVNLDELQTWHEGQHGGTTPPGEPPPIEPPPSTAPCRHPQFPQIGDGLCVDLGERTYNTRDRSKTGVIGSNIFTISTHNATATYVPEWGVERGKVLWTCRYRGGILSDLHGGNHYHQLNSFHRAHSRNSELAMNAPQLRLELDNLGTNPRAILWNYNSGDREQVVELGNEWKVVEGEEYSWAVGYNYNQEEGDIVFALAQNSRRCSLHFMVEPKSYRFQYFFPLGHVGPQGGHVEFWDVRFST